MPLSLYDFAVPTALRGLSALKCVLDKAQKHIDEKNISEKELMLSNLSSDMKPLDFQIYSTINFADMIGTELESIKQVKMTGYPNTLAGFQALIGNSVAILKSLDQAKFNEVEQKILSVRSPSGMRNKTYSGYEGMVYFAVPNLYFHLSMVYSILRLQDVPVGKQDYVAPPHIFWPGLACDQ
ncbi:hypothetical protein BKA61DRAFT_662176 [Leptodontidium sp. MPI-SDFR-AT-0119]|nr:hypothetical protein BKA61DRAFT_662176 [Leptodontidium sp. MPI-SDFR-AT-0119]